MYASIGVPFSRNPDSTAQLLKLVCKKVTVENNGDNIDDGEQRRFELHDDIICYKLTSDPVQIITCSEEEFQEYTFCYKHNPNIVIDVYAQMFILAVVSDSDIHDDKEHEKIVPFDTLMSLHEWNQLLQKAGRLDDNNKIELKIVYACPG